MKHITKVILLLFFGLLIISSCSKSIYVYSDEHGSSSFTIYKRNYKYTEKTAYTDFETWGTHYISNDSTLTFVYKKPDQLPYTYLKNNIRKTPKADIADFATIKIINQLTQEPIGFGGVALYDSLGQLLTGFETDINGFCELRTREKFTSIEITSLAYAKHIIRAEDLANYNFLVELEIAAVDFGGRSTNSCLVEFIDVRLLYKIDDKKHFQSFEKDGVVYKKQKG